jgi:hypothetical protein
MNPPRALQACIAILFGSASGQILNFTPVGSITRPVQMIKAKGAYAYVAAGPVFTIVDVADPTVPKGSVLFKATFSSLLASEFPELHSRRVWQPRRFCTSPLEIDLGSFGPVIRPRVKTP